MRGRRVILAVVAALLYAGCYAAIKAGLEYAPPLLFAALRSLISGIALLVVLPAVGRPLMPARRLWPVIAVLAVVGPVGFSAMFSSPLHTGAGLASVVGNTGPLIIIVLAALFLGERVTADKSIALLLGVAGLGLIARPGEVSSGAWHAPALLLPLLAASSRAAESLIVKWAKPGSDAISIAGWQFLLASVPLYTMSIALELGQGISWTQEFVLLLAFLAGGASAAATGLWYWLLQREEVSRLSLVLFLVPVAGLGLGTALFAEKIAAVQSTGILLIFAGIAAAAILGRRTATQTPPSRIVSR